MFDSAILDVAIGLAFIFLMVSLLVSAATEALAGWLKWRSTNLWDGLEHLLQSAQARNELYSHPLIKGLAKVSPASPQWNNGKNGPSYIPSRTFALAVVDILRRPHKVVNELERDLKRAATDASTDPASFFASVEPVLQQLADRGVPDEIKKDIDVLRQRIFQPVDASVVGALKQKVRAQLDRMSASDRAAAAGKVSEWLDAHADVAVTYADLRSTLMAAVGAVPFAGSTSTAEQLRTTLESIVADFSYGRPEDAVREIQAFLKDAPSRWLKNANASFQSTVDTLSPLLHEAADDVDRFRENIEIWFNDGMDRVTGWYKRHVGLVQAAIAVVLAFVMNIDAIQITRTLWREPTLRQSLVANATVFAKQEENQVAAGSGNDEPTETIAEGGGLKVVLQAARLIPNGVTVATISLPAPASPGAAVVVTRQTSNVFLGETNGDISKSALTILPAEKATEVEFFIKAGAVTAQSKETATVETRGFAGVEDRKATPTLTIAPAMGFAALQREIGGLGLPIGWSCPTDAEGHSATDSGTTVGGPFWCTSPPGNSGRRWTSASWLGVKNGSGQNWHWNDWAAWKALQTDGPTVRSRLGMLVMMIFGWLITASATSLGAPFWFDSLKRIISIRSSGKAPEEKPLAPKEVSQPREPGQRPRDADLLNALKG